MNVYLVNKRQKVGRYFHQHGALFRLYSNAEDCVDNVEHGSAASV